ncbi:unnamed protein product, partial [Rotaria socialis]
MIAPSGVVFISPKLLALTGATCTLCSHRLNHSHCNLPRPATGPLKVYGQEQSAMNIMALEFTFRAS